MTKYHADYVWKGGLPYGIKEVQKGIGITYKIVSDPYHKRNSIEKYEDGKFIEVIYDSALFDFRHLKPEHQYAWEKTTVEETDGQVICEIRDQNDRLVLKEKHVFEGDKCRTCYVYAPHGPLLSVQKILYKECGDPFDGVTLYDSNEHVVLTKEL